MTNIVAKYYNKLPRSTQFWFSQLWRVIVLVALQTSAIKIANEFLKKLTPVEVAVLGGLSLGVLAYTWRNYCQRRAYSNWEWYNQLVASVFLSWAVAVISFSFELIFFSRFIAQTHGSIHVILTIVGTKYLERFHGVPTLFGRTFSNLLNDLFPKWIKL